jgi:hypothetical protein
MPKAPPTERGSQPVQSIEDQNSTEDGRDHALGRPEFVPPPSERAAFVGYSSPGVRMIFQTM